MPVRVWVYGRCNGFYTGRGACVGVSKFRMAFHRVAMKSTTAPLSGHASADARI